MQTMGGKAIKENAPITGRLAGDLRGELGRGPGTKRTAEVLLVSSFAVIWGNRNFGGKVGWSMVLFISVAFSL